MATTVGNDDNEWHENAFNTSVEYQPTRAQRRCKHPKWVKVAEHPITHTVTERCSSCAMIQQAGGWFGGRFGAYREALLDVDRRSTSMDASD